MPAVAAVAVVVAGSGAAATIGGAITFGLASGMAATIIGGAVIGAVAGGITAAVTGEDILDGALQGGLIGGLTAGVMAFGAETAATTEGLGTGAEAVAATEVPASTQMAVGTMPAEQAVAVTGQNVMAAGGKVASEGMFGLSQSELLTVSGSLVQGAGEMYAAKVGEDAEEEAAATAYERNRAKLQEGVGLMTPKVALDKDAWKKSGKNRQPEEVASAAVTETLDPTIQGSATTVASATPQVSQPGVPDTPEKFESTVQKGLLNTA
jgi:hypothetical protein